MRIERIEIDNRGETQGKIQLVEIDLEPLYEYGIQKTSEELLETILRQYEAIDYVLLYSASPDIDVIFHSKEFKEYVEKCVEEDKSLEECALEYAGKHGYEKLVKLFDGYEEAVAVIRNKDDHD